MDEICRRVRGGEIIHLTIPPQFNPIFNFLTLKFKKALNINGTLAQEFSSIDGAKYCSGVASVVAELDQTLEHYRIMAQCLALTGIANEEAFLRITLDKSLRTARSGQYKKNYGYLHHKDSWFDLSPDGVNIAIYLTDVPYEANTIFYKKYFQTPLTYDAATKKPVGFNTDNDLGEITTFDCKAGDVLIFAGDHLHSGPRFEIDRLSIEFRLSQLWGFGRPAQDIFYQPVSDFLI